MEAMLDLVGSVYEAALHPAGMSEATQKVAASFDALASWFYVMDPARAAPYVANEATGYSDTAVEQYRDCMWRLDYAVQAALVPGKTFETHELISQRQRQADEFATWKRDIAGSNRLIGRSSRSLDGFVVGLTLHFPNDLRRKVDERQRFETIFPHVSRAFQLAGRLSLEDKTDQGAAPLFRSATLVLDRQCRVRWMNERARILLDRNDGLTLRNSTLAVSHFGDRGNLKFACNAHLSGSGAAAATMVAISRPSGRPRYLIEFHPAPPLVQSLAGSASALLLIVHDADDAMPSASARWQLTFSLTNAEVRVAHHLSRGEADDHIASRLGIAVSTVRSHVKAILDKTRTRTKAELAHLLTVVAK